MASAPANLRAEVSQFVKDTMDNTELGPLAMFKLAQQKMLATKTGRYQRIHPRLMLIHPKKQRLHWHQHLQCPQESDEDLESGLRLGLAEASLLL